MGDAESHVRYFCDKLQLVSLLGRAEGTWARAFIPSWVMLHLGTTSLLGPGMGEEEVLRVWPCGHIFQQEQRGALHWERCVVTPI